MRLCLAVRIDGDHDLARLLKSRHLVGDPGESAPSTEIGHPLDVGKAQHVFEVLDLVGRARVIRRSSRPGPRTPGPVPHPFLDGVPPVGRPGDEHQTGAGARPEGPRPPMGRRPAPASRVLPPQPAQSRFATMSKCRRHPAEFMKSSQDAFSQAVFRNANDDPPS